MNSLQLDPRDNVLVACRQILPGTRLQTIQAALGIAALEVIPAGHKVASRSIARGETVIKYGNRIGIATCDIAPGQQVHSQNLVGDDSASRSAPSRRTYVAEHSSVPLHFDGYRRADGTVGTRNFVGILATVNCSVSLARMLAARVAPPGSDPVAGIDGVIAIGHGSGCGMSRAGEGFELLRRTLSGYARHPNFGGVLLLGLGCEQNQLQDLIDDFGLARHQHIDSMVIQDNGGTRGTLVAGEQRLRQLMELARAERRVRVPASALKLALQCGGSDGFSGISANPALGVASDLLVQQGGTAVLSETPEIVGAEHLLLQRATSSAVANRLQQRVAWWREYAHAHGARLDQNPSPGNLAGGITTLAEKSLGAVAKSGSGPLVQVCAYAEPIEAAGVVFMDSPGYDPVAVTGQVASGCTLVCFTTGRGSVYGCRPVPSLKLATTTALFESMPEDIDLNCGAVVDGELSVAEMGARILACIIATASGKRTQSEQFDYGSDEFQPWQVGAVL